MYSYNMCRHFHSLDFLLLFLQLRNGSVATVDNLIYLYYVAAVESVESESILR